MSWLPVNWPPSCSRSASPDRVTTFSSTWDSQGKNYIFLSERSSASGYTLYDNFEVTAIPEPASMGLLVGALLLLRLCRRPR